MVEFCAVSWSRLRGLEAVLEVLVQCFQEGHGWRFELRAAGGREVEAPNSHGYALHL